MDFEELTSKKVGGIPVIYLAAGLALVLLYMAIRMRNSPTDTAEPTDATGTDVGGDFQNPAQPTFTANPTVLAAGSGSAGVGTYVEPTNDAWARRVLEWLISPDGGSNYDAAMSMLTKFLAGESLSLEEARLRNKAIAKFGVPPEPVDYSPISENDTGDGGTDPTPADPEDPVDPVDPDPGTPDPGTPDPGTPDPGTPDPGGYLPPPVTDTSTPPPPAPHNPGPQVPPTLPPSNGPASAQGTPPCNHKVKGKSDDSAGELANLYYHRNSNEAQGLIRSANATKDWSKPIPVGTNLYIPEWREPQYFVATSACRSVQDIARKNGTTPEKLRELNPNKQFPVAVGTRVRVK
jgi:hypothetical protein